MPITEKTTARVMPRIAGTDRARWLSFTKEEFEFPIGFASGVAVLSAEAVIVDATPIPSIE